jgi:hypothetical protein
MAAARENRKRTRLLMGHGSGRAEVLC